MALYVFRLLEGLADEDGGKEALTVINFAHLLAFETA